MEQKEKKEKRMQGDSRNNDACTSSASLGLDLAQWNLDWQRWGLLVDRWLDLDLLGRVVDQQVVKVSTDAHFLVRVGRWWRGGLCRTAG